MTDEELQAMDFRCYVTAAGFNYEATAKALSKTVNIQYIQLDRGMLPAEQSPIDLTKMVDSYGEQGRFNASVTEDPDNPGCFIVSCNIPADHRIDGKGYVIKGAAAVLDNGIIYAYRRVESDYKVVGQGSAKSYIIRLRFLPSNADVISFTIDPSVVLVTQADLADQKKILIAADADVLQQAKGYADTQDDELKAYVLANYQFGPYESARTYRTGEICTSIDSDTGELKLWQMYAGPNLTCKGKAPTDPANRPSGWTDTAAPCWWIEYHGNVPGQFAHWPSDDVPENAIKLADTALDATQFWRIAARHPSLVTDGQIKIVDVLGRYIRSADAVNYLVGNTHEDAIRNIEGTVAHISESFCVNGFADGVFSKGNQSSDSHSPATIDLATTSEFKFDASTVVPTASQNQPVTSIMNAIMYI